MADSLPLIPEKGPTNVCTDVKPVLRRVFQNLDILPPLAVEPKQKSTVGNGDDVDVDDGEWIEDFKKECTEFHNRETELKQQFAERLSRKPLPNIYRLHPHSKRKAIYDHWRENHGILERSHLLPSITQNPDIDETLWIKNILHKSSGDLTSVEIRGSSQMMPIQLQKNKYTDESWSFGEMVTAKPPSLPLPPPPPPQPDHIVCIPPHLEFVNFVVGDHYEQQLQLVNVSKFEVRLSVRPPSRRELLVEMTSSRGLTVTSGSAATFNIHFTPRDVLTVQDEFIVRVSSGKTLNIPIRCYMQPPILEIKVPSISPSVFFCTPDESDAAVHDATDTLELGAKLLGDVHNVKLMFHSDAYHASFFLLTEDAWVSFSLEELTSAGSTLCGNFTIWPSWWSGGGAVRGGAWCRADVTGLHVATLRVLSSTATVRHLHLLADSLYFHQEHVTIEAHEKDYDICSDDDPDCEYYVYLGTAFPNQPLSATVSLVNHSPITYSFYWKVRPWGVCTCSWDEKDLDVEESDMCVGAIERKRKEQLLGVDESEQSPAWQAQCVDMEPARGALGARSRVPLHVRVARAAPPLGTQRAVLMLVLKDVPVESFPPGYEPTIIKTTSARSQHIPGVQSWKHDVCEIICCQMEVWWDVAPVRFVLDPPLLPIIYSRRVQSVDIILRATLLFGTDSINGTFEAPPHVDLPKTITMNATNSYLTHVRYALPVLPNEHREFDSITLTAANSEWKTSCSTWRQCAARAAALRPARALLGVVPPARRMHAALLVANDTHQHICWWCTVYRWLGERQPAAACEGQLPCEACRDRACSCALLRPARGALPHAHAQHLQYQVNAPDRDGIVATLVQLRRTGADVAQVMSGAGTEARSSLIAYRVLAPQLVLRAHPCWMDKQGGCGCCALDPGVKSPYSGSAMLRPARALRLHLRTCYRLHITNITPIPTHVSWDTPLEQDALSVKFMPKDFYIGGYAQVVITVVLQALKVTGRRLFVYRAQVEHAYKPLYLLIDAAIEGLKIICEVPIGEEEHTSSTLIMKRTQHEVFPWEENKPKFNTPEEIFAENDRLRADKRCRCSFEMLYVPPEPGPPRPPQEGDDHDAPEIISEPPKLTAICKCFAHTAPVLPEHEETLCLQFKQLPLHTVRSRVITVRNDSVLTARLMVAFRRWQRKQTRTVDKDKWSADVRPPGVIVQCTPSASLLPPNSALRLRVDVYCDCWGVYCEQMLIKVEHLSPIVLDVWIESVGSPLMFALTMPHVEETPVIWVSSTDPDRLVRVKNVSRSSLALQACITTEHEFVQDELPFRLYIKFYDVPPRTCPCMDYEESVGGETTGGGVSAEACSSCADVMDTMIALLLQPDFGPQTNDYFQVSPTCETVEAGAWHQWRVTLQPPQGEELAPDSLLIVNSLPIDNVGPGWWRPPPAPRVVRLRHAPRHAALRVSCCEILVKLSALDLPPHDVMRVRKKFRVSNMGSLGVSVQAACEAAAPWSVVRPEPQSACAAACCCTHAAAHRAPAAALHLAPRSSQEVCVELTISPRSAWPEPPATACSAPAYAPLRRTDHRLTLYDEHQIYKSIPLVLELEYPIIRVEPAHIDFGFVTDGDTRKSYFTVSHTSRSTALDMVAEWLGPKEFRIRPTYFRLQPGDSERVYIQYLATWCSAPVEGCLCVCVGGGGGGGAGAGAWCRAGARAGAQPVRDVRAARLHADHTDDAALLPPDCEARALRTAPWTLNTYS